MENTKKLTANYIISRLYKENIFYFTTQMLADIFNTSRDKAYQRVFSLKQQGLIREIERGKYLVLGFQPQRVLANPFFIGSQIVTPSYISFRTALNHYGLTEQVPFTVYMATTKRKREVEFEGHRYKYITLSHHKFFGYVKELIGELPVLLAEPEKALVDSFDQLQYGGGFVEVAKALFNAKGTIDNQKLIDYALKIKNKALCSRLGFLLDKYQMSTEGLGENLSTSPILLDPAKVKSNVWDKIWRVNKNISDESLYSWMRT